MAVTDNARSYERIGAMSVLLKAPITEPEFLKKKTFRRGEIIFREGEMGNQAYIVVTGTVEVFRYVEGEKVSLASLRKGELFGEMALVDNSLRMATAVARERTGVVIIPRVLFYQSLGESNTFVHALIRILVTNLRNVHKSYMRRARSVDDYVGAIGFFLGGLRQYMDKPAASDVRVQALKHIERIDREMRELRAVFAEHEDDRQSVLTESDMTHQGKPEPLDLEELLSGRNGGPRSC